MRAWISWSSIFVLLAAVLLLATAPSALRRLIRTGDPYLFTKLFFHDMLARLSGPGRIRFLVQPAAAITLGLRDGKKDAQQGFPPFLLALISHRGSRPDLRGAWESVRTLVAVAVILDMASQWLIFRNVHPGAALILGPLLIAVPYTLSRAATNRVSRIYARHRSTIHC